MKTFTTKCSMLALLLLLLSQGVFAQKEANNWYFGSRVGMTWNTTQTIGGLSGLPTPLPSSAMYEHHEGVCAMSDSEGNLMFYSDGVTVWNKNHQVMLNGSGLLGHVSSAQSGIVVPYPGQPKKWILMTIGTHGNNRFAYSVIDMDGDGGLGAVTIEKNIPFEGVVGRSGETLTAVRHANGKDYWVITKTDRVGSPGNVGHLCVWKITTSGVDINCHSSIPLPYDNGMAINTYLRFSADGKRFAWPNFNNRLFFGTFDPSNGTFPIIKVIECGHSSYGLEFSPSGEILYLANTKYFANPLIDNIHVYKFADLLALPNEYTTSPISHRIMHTGVFDGVNMCHALQLGPDGRIYSAIPYTTDMIVIDDVENYNGSTIRRISGLLPTGPDHHGIYGLPNFMSHYLVPPTAGVIGADTTICLNTAPATLISIAEGVGATSFKWERSIDNGDTWTVIPGATTTTYSPGTLTQTTQYRREDINDVGSEYTNVVTITVAAAFNPGKIGSNQTVCSGGTPAAFTSVVLASGGTGTTTYQWQRSTDGTIFSAAAGTNTAATYTPTGTHTQTTYYRRRATNTCGTAFSDTITITISTGPSPGTIGTSHTICPGGVPNQLTSVTSASAGAAYQWQRSTNGTSWSNAPGTNSAAAYTPTGAHTQTTYYRRTAINNCGIAYSDTVTITVSATVNPGTIGTNHTVCSGATPNLLTSVANASAGATYLWEQAASSGGPWTTISGATSATYQPPTITATTYYRRRATSPCGNANSNVVTVTVAPAFNPGKIGSSQTICTNATPAAFTSTTNASGGTGATTYLWQRSTNGTSWSNAPGTNSAATYTPTGAHTQTTYYRRQATNTCGTGYSDTITITISATVSPGKIGTNHSVCLGETPDLLTSVTNASAGATYQWQQATSSMGTYTNISGATNATYQPPVMTVTRFYRRVATSSCGTAYSDTVQVSLSTIVNPGKIVGDTTICSGGTAVIRNAGHTTGATWSWEHSTNGTTFTAAPGTGTQWEYTTPALTVTTHYRRVATSSCGIAYSDTVTVTVAPALNAGAIGTAQTICAGDAPATLTSTTAASGGTGTLTYQWQSSTDNSTWTNISGATALTYTPPTLTASTYYRRNATNTCGTVSTASVLMTLQLAPDVYPVPSLSSAVATGNAVSVTVGINNQGDAPIGSPVYVTLYKNSVSAANKIASGSSNITIAAGGTGTVVVNIPNIMPHMPFADIIVRVNDNDGTFPAEAECGMLNNEMTLINPLLNLLVKKDAELLSVSGRGAYPNPISVLGNEVITYKITATNPLQTSANIVIVDTVPAYLGYVTASASPSYTSMLPTSIPGQSIIRWVIAGVPSMQDAVVSFDARPASGAAASQPLFINHAMVSIARAPGDSIHIRTNGTFHQGAGISIMTFSAGLGGEIFNATEQALDYMSTPTAGIIIAPEEGYKFAGWSHDDYTSLRGVSIRAQRGIMHYDTLTVYGNIELHAEFVPVEASLDEENEEIEPMAASARNEAWSVKDELFITTASAGSIVRIYSTEGVLCEQHTIVSAGTTSIKLPRGIYIVTINNDFGNKVRIE